MVALAVIIALVLDPPKVLLAAALLFRDALRKAGVSVLGAVSLGVGGPIGFGDDPPWDDFHSAYERWCEEHRVVTTFVEMYPALAAEAKNAKIEMEFIPGAKLPEFPAGIQGNVLPLNRHLCQGRNRAEHHKRTNRRKTL